LKARTHKSNFSRVDPARGDEPWNPDAGIRTSYDACDIVSEEIKDLTGRTFEARPFLMRLVVRIGFRAFGSGGSLLESLW
jgi:hypothetical protein